MLVDKVLRALDVPDSDERGGNPLRGSRLGRCARQSAYMLFPDAYEPAPLPARAKLVFAFGNMIHDLVRANFRKVCPGQWGMEEDRFHFKVPLTVHETKCAMRLFMTGALHGTVEDRGRANLWRDGHSSDTFRATHKRGLWLATWEPALYIPLHVDGIAECEGELASAEIKSMATGSFKRAVAGHVEYSYRVQMAAAVDATGLDAALYVACRKDTSHLLEVHYAKRFREVAVTFTKQPWTSQQLGIAVEDGGDWEAAEVRHPFEPHLLEQARERVRRVLRATVVNLPEREYGPDFRCPTCEGTGTQTKNKATGQPLKRGPRTCQDCRSWDGGLPGYRGRAELPWQCRYCPYVAHCWPMATLEIEGERPHYWITREDFEVSAITFRSPEAP